MTDADLGRALRECRESVRPPYSRRELAECVLTSPHPTVAPFSYPGTPDTLSQAIQDFENSGSWLPARGLLAPFLALCYICLHNQGVGGNPRKELLQAVLAAAFVDPPDDPLQLDFLINLLP